MSTIEFQQVSKRYGSNPPVIEDLNLAIQSGEFMVLVGPSGCAKSTTLRMIAGLETITRGSLLINGEAVNRLPPAERNISMVFQSYALFPNMTVRQNLSFGMRIRKTERQVVEREVSRVAELLALTEYLDRKPRQLSGGQAQRVALGRAIIRQPSAYLFDEPLSNLDAELRVQMRSEISALQKSSGTTTVYVTHDQVEAMTMGDRIAVMQQGKIMQIGSPAELYNDPANSFVAGFIGSPKINLFSTEELHYEGISQCLVGIRPEHVQLESSTVDTAISMTGRVTRVEDLGHESLLQIDIGAASPLIARISNTLTQRLQLAETITVTLPHKNMIFFDPNSGARL